MYHPLTPFFVLFCNVVATSQREDFNTLELVTSQLDGLVQLSPSIARLQALFKSFVGLCKGLVASETDIRSQPMRDEEYGTHGRLAQDFAVTSYPFHSYTKDQTQFDGLQEACLSQQTPSAVSTSMDTMSAHVDTISSVDPSWELFDIQPTLDWLDADFSFFDSNQ